VRLITVRLPGQMLAADICVVACSHFTWWGLMVLALFCVAVGLDGAEPIAVTAICIASGTSDRQRRGVAV
jgi:hypothetical protein